MVIWKPFMHGGRSLADVASLNRTSFQLADLLTSSRAVSSLQALMEDVGTVAVFNSPFFSGMAAAVQTYKIKLDALPAGCVQRRVL